MSVYEGIVAFRNEDTDQPHSTVFQTAVQKKVRSTFFPSFFPSRRPRFADFALSSDLQAYPTYHLIVKKPIWLNKIKKEIKDNKYKTVQGLWDDLVSVSTRRVFSTSPLPPSTTR